MIKEQILKEIQEERDINAIKIVQKINYLVML